jgi:hypothetical protein
VVLPAAAEIDPPPPQEHGAPDGIVVCEAAPGAGNGQAREDAREAVGSAEEGEDVEGEFGR